jgi:hypothetical protein
MTNCTSIDISLGFQSPVMTCDHRLDDNMDIDFQESWMASPQCFPCGINSHDDAIFENDEIEWHMESLIDLQQYLYSTKTFDDVVDLLLTL